MGTVRLWGRATGQTESLAPAERSRMTPFDHVGVPLRLLRHASQMSEVDGDAERESIGDSPR
jgi:hypothetical protein